MDIRLAKSEEIDEIKHIYDLATSFMQSSGNQNQWINGYPQKSVIADDIENNNLYVYLIDGKIAAVFCFFIGEDKTYNVIDGSWLNDKPYGVIHRIAVVERGKGIASQCIQWCIKKFGNIRIDTHEDNIPMQKTILKNGFTYCGTIKREDGTERLAYQRAD